MKKHVVTAAAVAALALAQHAAAAQHEKAEAKAPAIGSQQNKMKTCNKEAGEKKLKGDERKKFMSGCLRADAK